MECTEASENVRMLLCTSECIVGPSPVSCEPRCVWIVLVLVCATVRVSMWVKNVLHIRVVRGRRVGRPVAARRISRSCVVAAGLLARGDTRTEERDVRGGGGYLGRH